MKQNCRKKIKFLKRRNLQTTSTERKKIAKCLRGGIYKPKLQEKQFKIPKRHGCFLRQNMIRNKNQLRTNQGRTGKISASPGGNETIVWNICSYRVPEIFGTNASTNEIISSTNEQCRPFHEEEENDPQRLDPCVLILLIWEPG